MDYLGRADHHELIQILESLLAMPTSVAKSVRVPWPDELPPGKLALETVDPALLTSGVATQEDLYPQADQGDLPPELRKYPIPLAQKMRPVLREHDRPRGRIGPLSPCGPWATSWRAVTASTPSCAHATWLNRKASSSSTSCAWSLLCREFRPTHPPRRRPRRLASHHVELVGYPVGRLPNHRPAMHRRNAGGSWRPISRARHLGSGVIGGITARRQSKGWSGCGLPWYNAACWSGRWSGGAGHHGARAMVAAGCTRWIAVLVALILPVVAAGAGCAIDVSRGSRHRPGRCGWIVLEPLTPARPFPPTAGSNSLSGGSAVRVGGERPRRLDATGQPPDRTQGTGTPGSQRDSQQALR